MTTDEQKITIAEVCGFQKEHHFSDHWHHPITTEAVYFHQLPDYCNDLNAIHTAEKFMDGGQRGRYVLSLSHSAAKQPETWFPQGAPELFLLLSATASQRAEAFLRALSLWK